MNVSYACVIAAYAVVLLAKLPLAIAQAKLPGGYDNNHPRAQQDKLAGMGARSRGAHLNGFEAFPFFAASVIMANVAHVDVTMVNRLAVAHVVLRVAYGLLYIGNMAPLRSLAWAAAAGASLWLMVLAMLA